MANIHDVAQRAGVSAMTVSRVLNGSARVSEATRQRVLQAIAELQYIPNGLARGLVRQQTRILALMIPDVSNPFFTTIARGVEDEANRQGYAVILCNTDEDAQKEAEYVRTALQIRADGVIIAPAGDLSRPNLALLQHKKVPFVLLDREVAGVEADLIRGDSRGGARRLVEHLIRLGHRRIALLGGPLTTSTARDRLQGYEDALRAAGLPVDPALVREAGFRLGGGEQAVRELLALPERPTAIFAANNFLALTALGVLRQAGLRVPEDVALVAFDDIPAASAADPFLTVAAQPAYTFGTMAARFLLERLSGNAPATPRHVVLPPELHVRRSCGSGVVGDSG